MTSRKFLIASLLTAAGTAVLIAILPGPLAALVVDLARHLLAWSFAAFFTLGFVACLVVILASLFRP